jgi:hypothetical protein
MRRRRDSVRHRLFAGRLDRPQQSHKPSSPFRGLRQVRTEGEKRHYLRLLCAYARTNNPHAEARRRGEGASARRGILSRYQGINLAGSYWAEQGAVQEQPPSAPLRLRANKIISRRGRRVSQRRRDGGD